MKREPGGQKPRGITRLKSTQDWNENNNDEDNNNNDDVDDITGDHANHDDKTRNWRE